MATTAITPFRLEIPDADLEDLRDRLRRTRWPEAQTVDDWSQGVPLGYVREVCEYWATSHDWRRAEAELNTFDQFTTRVDDLDIHFIHARSPVEGAQPLIVTHGWPGSIFEFLDVIGPLTDPVAHGGDGADAFHVVCPSLPGYGLSGRPSVTGWGVERIAAAWVELMRRLGYERFGAQGGDWGGFITAKLGELHPDALTGIHVNLAFANPEELMALGEPTEEELGQLGKLQTYLDWENGYAQQQSTRPQTLGYALTDSPAGQCAWILEKFGAWTDCDGHPEKAIGRDRILDNISLYWPTATATSSARLYWESFKSLLAEFAAIGVPAGYTMFPRELSSVTERWLRTRFTDLRYYAARERGGHFAALEQPAAFVDEVRAAFRAMR
jgi:pimeloyl-ACP methyl ester carboxylesterase